MDEGIQKKVVMTPQVSPSINKDETNHEGATENAYPCHSARGGAAAQRAQQGAVACADMAAGEVNSNCFNKQEPSTYTERPRGCSRSSSAGSRLKKAQHHGQRQPRQHSSSSSSQLSSGGSRCNSWIGVAGNHSFRNSGSSLDRSRSGASSFPLWSPHPFYRVKMCPWFPEGRCNYGNQCSYAHSESELRSLPRNKRSDSALGAHGGPYALSGTDDLRRERMAPWGSKGLLTHSQRTKQQHGSAVNGESGRWAQSGGTASSHPQQRQEVHGALEGESISSTSYLSCKSEQHSKGGVELQQGDPGSRRQPLLTGPASGFEGTDYHSLQHELPIMGGMGRSLDNQGTNDGAGGSSQHDSKKILCPYLNRKGVFYRDADCRFPHNRHALGIVRGQKHQQDVNSVAEHQTIPPPPPPPPPPELQEVGGSQAGGCLSGVSRDSIPLIADVDSVSGVLEHTNIDVKNLITGVGGSYAEEGNPPDGHCLAAARVSVGGRPVYGAAGLRSPPIQRHHQQLIHPLPLQPELHRGMQRTPIAALPCSAPYYPLASPSLGSLGPGMETPPVPHYWFQLMHAQNSFYGGTPMAAPFVNPQLLGIAAGPFAHCGGLRLLVGYHDGTGCAADTNYQPNPFLASVEELNAAAPTHYED